MKVIPEIPTIRFVWPDTGVELDLAALQGLWTADMYLKLTEQTNYLLEFTDGMIEILPLPTRSHQRMLAYLYGLLVALVYPQGEVLFAPLRLQIRARKYREPDLLLLLDRTDPRNQETCWLDADLVVEIASPDNPERDTVVKRGDYAEAGIPEYWIINLLTETVTVLNLDDTVYVEHGVFVHGEQAHSQLLTSFAVSVDAIFDAQ